MDLLRLQRDASWDKEDWFPPLAAALAGVGPAEAAWLPPGGGNTIWQTVNHLNYYNERLLCRLTGASFGPELPDNDATFSDPGDPTDVAGWAATLERTHRIAAGLGQVLAGCCEAGPDQPLSPVASAALGEQLPHVILHDAYHTGQIVLIRKQQGSWPAQRG